jgi:prepilin-type N-terminal cleavage/methylation domain-containing protein/prepilin-type processing-associated H-X9-DG protein
MKAKRDKRAKAGMTLIEVIAVIAVVVVLVGLAIGALSNAIRKSRSICCDCNLKQIGLSFRIFANDHNDTFPMGVSTNKGGSLEYLTTNEMFRHFQVMSNELSTPVILICPTDTRKAVKSFSVLSNTNVSYFVGVDANDKFPQSLLAGDRNLMTNGGPVGSGLLELKTNQTVGWTAAMHNGRGNAALGDGSVSGFTPALLREQVIHSGLESNRLLIP